ncbi:MAG: tyrosine-type recombinase/integrase [Roseiarcus sp.]
MKIDLPYLFQDVDRHGNIRHYVRKKIGGKHRRVRLTKPPGSATFMSEYQAALCRLNGPLAPAKADQSHVGTLGWLAQQYQQSHAFRSTDPRQQRMRANVMRSIQDEPTKPGSKFKFVDCPISEFTADHVRLLRNRKQDTPAAANRRVAELRKMLAWAVEERGQWVKRNVAAEVKGLKREVKGFIAWTAEEIAKFEAHWPVGSMPRLAVAIMLFTGVRRSDAVLLGPPMVDDGSITFMPQKTRRQNKVLTLPILDVLQQVLDKTPHGLKTWLVHSKGEPFTAAGFGGWFRERCDEAGLTGCTAHGLRKVAAETAAENGATEKQMMDIFGWTKSDLAAYYARGANQPKIAGGAMHTLVKKAS